MRDAGWHESKPSSQQCPTNAQRTPLTTAKTSSSVDSVKSDAAYPGCPCVSMLGDGPLAQRRAVRMSDDDVRVRIGAFDVMTTTLLRF